MDDATTLRRKAASAMIELIMQHWPAYAALRDEQRNYDTLFAALRGADDEIECERLFAALEQSQDRLGQLIDLVTDQIG